MKQYDFSNKKLYNGTDCHEGMKVAPWVVEDKKVAIEIGVKAEYIETYRLPSGKKYLVTFVEVPEEEFESYMSRNYSQQIRDFFDDYGNNSYKEQFSRCVINGKVCAMSNHCSTCQKRDENGELRRDNKHGMMSLDMMMEDGHEPSLESTVDTEMLYEQLLEAAGKLEDYYPEIIKRKRNGESNSDIIKDLPVKKSKAYKDLKAVEEFVREFLK